MTAPNWARTVRRARRLMADLRTLDIQCIEPPNFETPPSRRYAQGGPVTGVAVILGEHGAEVLVDRDPDRL